MPACANCARELRPDWKFCVFCGTPTGVTGARPELRAPAMVDPVDAEPAAPALEPAPAPPLEPEPEPIPVAPAPEPVREPALVGAAAPALTGTHAPTLLVAPPAPAEPAPATSIRTRSRSRGRVGHRRVNPLAIVALVLGCLVSPLAALFGHLALVQISTSGERGRLPAIVAIVLGYGSLAFIVGLAIIYLTAHV